MPENDTIVAAATPPGESAIAMIRLSGPRCGPLAAELRAGRPPLPRRAWHGDYRSRLGTVIDDVVCCFFPAPHSYTGGDVLEVATHGNPFIVSKILDDLCARGCRVAEPGEFTRRAFLSGRLDLTRAEAVMDVIRARSDRALEASHRQLRGSLGRRVDALVDRTLRTCAAIEAYIDFPEEDLPAEDRVARGGEIAALRAEVAQMRAHRVHADLLREGVQVILVGEPNAGKSSLLNRLAGYERAIVSEEPGTTRDFLEESLLVGPHRIRLIDTAGLREVAGFVERAGVERTLARAEEADVFLLVVDAGRPAPALPAPVAGRLGPANTLVVVNKTDLPARRFAGFAGLDAPSLDVSALRGTGFPALEAHLLGLLDRLTGTGASDEGVVINARHHAALAEAATCLDHAGALLADESPLELVGSELRGALDALGQIVGRIDNEAMLDRLFAAFCIGK